MTVTVAEAVRRLKGQGVLQPNRLDQSAQVIARVQTLLGQDLPQDLVAFYVANIEYVGDFAAIAPTWNDRVGWLRESVKVTDLLHVQAVPLFLDGFGNLFGLDLTPAVKPPAVYFFDHEYGYDQPQYAAGSCLGAFLLLLAEQERAYKERRPAGWELAIDPDIDKCPRAPPLWLAR